MDTKTSREESFCWLEAYGRTPVRPRRDQSGLAVFEWLVESTQTTVVVQIQNAPLRWAWVYWRDGGNLVTLRTDGAGRLYTTLPGAARADPWEYNTPFRATPGTPVDVYYSRGGKPIPDSTLQANLPIFLRRAVAATISLPELLITITEPADLEFWPVLWESPSAGLATAGLLQGASLWSGGNLAVSENGPSPAPPAGTRPRERALVIRGTIDARATGVSLRVLARTNTPIALKTDPTTTTTLQEVPGQLSTGSGVTKSFSATIFFADAVNAFGPVQILAQSVGLTPPLLTVTSVHLCGGQIALVDDHMASPNGQQRGPVLGEREEKIVVDFLDSPQEALSSQGNPPDRCANLSAQTRARRMTVYSFANHRRPLDPTTAAGAGNPDVLQPQMPLWMAEFQLVGATRQELADLLARRYDATHHGLIDPWTPMTLQVDLRWKLTLQWDGPDINSPPFPEISRPQQVYRYTQEWNDTQAVQLHYGSRGQFTDASARAIQFGTQGEVPNAFRPPATAVTFPIANRRRPQVIVDGQQRAWGRGVGGVLKPALVMEYQPRMVDSNGREILRGGDGTLELVSVSIDNRRLSPGLIRGANQALNPPAANDPFLRLPPFRVVGLNPTPHADVEALINALVEDRFRRDNAQQRVSLLSLRCWQTTVRRILAHENGGDHQFEHRGIGRRRFAFQGKTFCYGHEADLPLFGPPHGYGFGQLDSPPTSDNAAWSFMENIRESVRRIMVDKAGDALALLSAHLPTPANQRIRAVYQREIVRRYNGGSEFRWSGSDWEISPSLARWQDNHDHSKGANPRLTYPNNVLGTGVQYSHGTGSATTFPWPIAFTASDFGPDTA